MAVVSGGEARAFVEPEQGGNAGREFAFSEADFRHLVQLAYKYAGISLSESKRNLLYSRLSRRLRILGIATFGEYRELLESDQREIENFINSISTNHTKFFREAHHFDHMRDARRRAVRAAGGGDRQPAAAHLVGGLFERRRALHHRRRAQARDPRFPRLRRAHPRHRHRHRRARQGRSRRVRQRHRRRSAEDLSSNISSAPATRWSWTRRSSR